MMQSHAILSYAVQCALQLINAVIRYAILSYPVQRIAMICYIACNVPVMQPSHTALHVPQSSSSMLSCSHFVPRLTSVMITATINILLVFHNLISVALSSSFSLMTLNLAITVAYRDLSGGQKARVVFVELSLMAPHLLFLDVRTFLSSPLYFYPTLPYPILFVSMLSCHVLLCSISITARSAQPRLF